MKYRFRLVRKIIEEAYVEVEMPDIVAQVDNPMSEEATDWAFHQDEAFQKAMEEGKKLGNAFWSQVRTTQPMAEPPKWNKDHQQDQLCLCGHPYYRHFDSYEKMRAVGCKYCYCHYFVPKEDSNDSGRDGTEGTAG